MAALDRLHVLYADELAYHTGMDCLIKGPEIRAVAENVADSDYTAVLVCLVPDVLALLFALGNRLFEQDVVTHLQCLHARPVMQVVRSGYKHGVSKFWNLEHFAPVAETVFFVYAELVAHGVLATFPDIRNAHNLQALRISLCI